MSKFREVPILLPESILRAPLGPGYPYRALQQKGVPGAFCRAEMRLDSYALLVVDLSVWLHEFSWKSIVLTLRQGMAALETSTSIPVLCFCLAALARGQCSIRHNKKF